MNRKIPCLADVIKTVRRKDFPRQSESNIKRAVIERIISDLGWSIHDFDEVVSECPTRFDSQTGRADYALRLEGRTKMFIEAKKPGGANAHAEEQTFKYAYQAGGRPLLTLTDGRIWKFYDPSAEGESREERCACELDLANDDAARVEAVLVEMLSKQALASGQAAKRMGTVLRIRQIEREYEAEHGPAAPIHHFLAQKPKPAAPAEDPPVAQNLSDSGQRRHNKGRIELVDADMRAIDPIPFTSGGGGWIALVQWLASIHGDGIMQTLQKALGDNIIADQPFHTKNGTRYKSQAAIAGKWVTKNRDWNTLKTFMHQAAQTAGYGIRVVEDAGRS